MIANLIKTADTLVIGGGMLFTFLAAQGFPVGKSLLEADQIEAVKGYLNEAASGGKQIVLPSHHRRAGVQGRLAGHRGGGERDPGRASSVSTSAPKSAKVFASVVAGAKTVFWNGPMGVAEWEAFAGGTKAVAQALTEVDGRRSSAAATRRRQCASGFADEAFGHISTGGGASLEYLEGKTLPGVAVLKRGGRVSRKPLMAGNWKINLDHVEAVGLVQKLAWTLEDKKHDPAKSEVVVLPPFTDLRTVQTLVDGDRLEACAYGAQDLSQHLSGAYTGDISAEGMLVKPVAPTSPSATPSVVSTTTRRTRS